MADSREAHLSRDRAATIVASVVTRHGLTAGGPLQQLVSVGVLSFDLHYTVAPGSVESKDVVRFNRDRFASHWVADVLLRRDLRCDRTPPHLDPAGQTHRFLTDANLWGRNDSVVDALVEADCITVARGKAAAAVDERLPAIDAAARRKQAVEELCGLDVATTRAKTGLEMVCQPAKLSKAGGLPASASGLLRGALLGVTVAQVAAAKHVAVGLPQRRHVNDAIRQWAVGHGRHARHQRGRSEQDSARVGRRDSGDQVQERRLARTAGADQRDLFAAVQFEPVDVNHRYGGPVRDDEPLRQLFRSKCRVRPICRRSRRTSRSAGTTCGRSARPYV